MNTTIQSENQILGLIRENSSHDQFNKVIEANTTEKGRLVMMQGAFRTVMKDLSDFLTKPSRAKLLEKTIDESHGDITKVKQINDVTLKALNILEKSKNPETKIDVQQAKAYYQALKVRKDSFKRVEHKKNNGSSFFEKFMGYILYLYYVLSVKMFVNYVSLILAQDVNGYKIGDAINKIHPFSIRNTVKAELEFFRNGNTDKAIAAIVEDKKDVKEDMLLMIAGITLVGLFALVTLALSIRIFVFYYYNTRMQLSDYFTEQADFLRLHETELKKNKNLSKVEADAIIKDQKVWADRFASLAEMVVVDEIDAGRKANKQIKESNKNVTVDNINQKNTGMEFF